MLKQHDLVNQCLIELQSSNLRGRYRWKLEVLLYQLRRLLLLDQVAEMVQEDPESEREFFDLHHAVKHACDPANTLPTLDVLVAVLTQMKEALYSYCRRGSASHSYGDDRGPHLTRH